MELNELLKEKQELSAWVEYRDGFKVHIRHLPRRELKALRKRATRKDWDKRSHQPVDIIEDDIILQGLADCVLGWKGLTREVALGVLPITEEAAEKIEGELPFTKTNALALIKEAYDFQEWLQDKVTDLAGIREAQKEGEAENLRSFR